MKNIEKITDKKELFDFVFLVEIAYTEDIKKREELIRQARKKADELGVGQEFMRELFSYLQIKEKEDEEKEIRALSGENRELETDKNGNVKKTIENYLVILRSDESFSSVCFNELNGRGEFEKKPWTDKQKSMMMHCIERKYGLKSERDFEHALNILWQERRYHPIREKIKALKWDGKVRIEAFLSKIMGVHDSEYTRECSRLIFHCGIARVFNPGCKVDDVIVLQGEQGNGKSTIASWLAMDEEWYGRVSDIRGNTGIEQIQGKWICEISELLAVSGTHRQEEAKQYLDRKSDNYRRPYAQFSEEIPRQCIFIGTTNLRQPFSDKTGNRRYYPVWCCIEPGKLYAHEKAVKKYIEQCWAEAYDLWQRGQIYHAVKRELFDTVSKMQKYATEDDWRIGIIEDFLETKTETCIIEVWTEGLGMSDKPNLKQSREISVILDNFDSWERGEGVRRFGEYKSQRFWRRKSSVRFEPIDENFVEIIEV